MGRNVKLVSKVQGPNGSGGPVPYSHVLFSFKNHYGKKHITPSTTTTSQDLDSILS